MTSKVKLSKGKKILIAVLCVFLALVIAITSAGAYVLKEYCKTKDYTITAIGDSLEQRPLLVAHRGFRGYAPENTEPAFIEAGEAEYWGAECDIYRTKDGVWVVHHDRSTYRMMDISKMIESSTYEELLDGYTDNGVNIDKYPNLRICRFVDYMRVCNNYNMRAVIELKEDNNQEYYNEIIDICNEYPLVNITFISFQFSDLQALRQITDKPLMYLVKEIKDEDIELAKSLENCGIDFDGNNQANYDNDGEMIKKCKDEGLNLGAWTIDDMDTLKKLLELGVYMITTDCITY